jgi:phosphatidate cytidylyltransferase
VRSGLTARIVTGAILLPVLFFLIHLGGWYYTALIALVVAVGAWEWGRLARLAPAETLWLGLGAVGAALAAARVPDATQLAVLAVYLAASLLLALRHAGGDGRRQAADLLLGLFYVGLFPAFLLRMRAMPDGRAAVILAHATVFFCDSCAYMVGRALGRRALWTRVSPRKTWEGAVAGLAAAVLFAVGGRALLADFLTPARAAGFGLIVGIFGQAGDLVESLWKREAGVKDSSALIPGHGGVLDRFDNLHFVAPILYAYLLACR